MKKTNNTIAVIGSGSWGVAISQHLAEAGNKVKIWSFTKEEKDLINNEHKCMFIPDVKLNENIVFILYNIVMIMVYLFYKY